MRSAAAIYRLGLALATVLAVGGAQAASLEERLRAAQGGEVIELPPGPHDKLDLKNLKFEMPVTVRSADPEDRATIFGLDLENVANLRFTDLRFSDSPKVGTRSRGVLVNIARSQSIGFEDIEVKGTARALRKNEGDLTEYYNGTAIYIRFSEDISIEDSTVSGFERGAGLHQSQDLLVRGNTFHSLRSDGLNVIEVQHVRIEDNTFRDFVTTAAFGDHPDMIQFWTAKTKSPTRDVVVRGNLLDSAGGGWTQAIFIRNEAVDAGGAGDRMFYRDLVIEDNLIRNGHKHGITVGETDGLTIRNNTVLYNLHQSWGTPSINLKPDSRNVTVTGNLAHGWPGGDRADWRVEDNLRIQRNAPGRPGWYGDLFVDALTDGPTDLAALQLLPGTEAAERSLGAPLTRREPPETLTAAIRPMPDPANGFAFAFDASYSAHAGRLLSAGDATYRWDFGDGATAEGIAVSHSYEDPGAREVRLSVRLPDGTQDEATARIEVAEPLLLDIGAGPEGLLDRSSYETEVPAKGVPTAPRGEGLALSFPNPKAGFRLERFIAPRIHDLNRFAIAFDIRADRPGEVFRVHHAFRGTVTDSGEFEFHLGVDGSGPVTLRTEGAGLLDGRWHSVAALYDAAQGAVALYVDGEPQIRAPAAGHTPQESSWNLNFGSIWKTPSFIGQLDRFRIYNAPIQAALD